MLNVDYRQMTKNEGTPAMNIKKHFAHDRARLSKFSDQRSKNMQMYYKDCSGHVFPCTILDRISEIFGYPGYKVLIHDNESGVSYEKRIPASCLYRRNLL